MSLGSFSTCTSVNRKYQTCTTDELGWGGGMIETPGSCIDPDSDSTLQPGESCDLVVVVTPEKKGSLKGYLAVWSGWGFTVVTARVRGV